VTFCTARPPLLSHFFVNCRGIKSSLSPRVITEDANLVVLHVPLDSRFRINFNRYSDYFVYRVDPRRPSLDLLPNPYPETFGDNEIAILSCNGDDFVVAALQVVPHTEPTFKLHLYRSTEGMWTSQLLSVEKLLRDKKFPIPDSTGRRVYHLTTKVIILRGDKGIVGWVDLWRGILLCNVLSSDPKLLDIPLPPPAKGNLEKENYLNRCPTYFRDITVNRTKDTIKYVEMEITLLKELILIGCCTMNVCRGTLFLVAGKPPHIKCLSGPVHCTSGKRMVPFIWTTWTSLLATKGFISSRIFY
jgi:hypothetical protein